MAAGTFVPVCSALLLVSVLVLVSAVQKNITAESGQNVTLTCRAANNNPAAAVEWSRADLGEEYVLLYRDKQLVPRGQHPSFKNRVDLQDRQMKDGDVSVILKNVTINDAGTYKCRVIQRVGEPLRLLSTIYLSVAPPGPGGGTTEDGGSAGLTVGLSVAAVLLLVVVVAALVGFVIYRKHKTKPDEASYLPPPEQQQG